MTLFLSCSSEFFNVEDKKKELVSRNFFSWQEKSLQGYRDVLIKKRSTKTQRWQLKGLDVTCRGNSRDFITSWIRRYMTCVQGELLGFPLNNEEQTSVHNVKVCWHLMSISYVVVSTWKLMKIEMRNLNLSLKEPTQYVQLKMSKATLFPHP